MTIVAFLAGVASGGVALAHGDDAHGARTSEPAESGPTPWGVAGDATKAARTVSVTMRDEMRFVPDRIDVVQGQTIRFRVTNAGRLPHELVLGTRQALAEHAAMMAKMDGMAHEAPYAAHVAPGKTGEIVWTFTHAGDFHFACLVPGHYEAGMSGTVHVAARRDARARH